MLSQIRCIAATDVRDNTSDASTLLSLMTWWCDRYNRPMKDPLLQSYSFEELMYEYALFDERIKAVKEEQEEADTIKEEQKNAELDKWIDEEEAKEQGSQASTPADAEWMNKMLSEQKAEMGEDFGEDISLNFDEV